MKRNLVMGFIVATMSFTNMLYADITLHSSAQNACEDISGYWSGTGKVYNWFIGECKYHGVGTISSLNNTGTFSVEVIATKDSGSYFCPNEAAESLTGVCINGMLTLMTQYGNLTGNFSKNAGSAFGTLSVSPGISADISVQFMRNE